MRILVLWADRRSPNLGVRVLAEGALDVARRVWPGATVDFQDFWGNESDLSIGGRAVLEDIGRRRGRIKSKLRQYDLVLDTGAGDGFTDIYTMRKLVAMHYTRAVARAVGARMVMLPQTVGPFGSPVARLLARRSLRLMDEVWVRDSVSRDVARRLGRQQVGLSTDLVFALEPPPATDQVSSDVLLNVSGLLWRDNRHVDHEKYRRTVRELYERLVGEGRVVTLFAHVLESPSPHNDIPAVREFAAELPGDVDIVVPRSLDHARAVIAGSNLVIASRMHACLNALSCGVPAIALAYSRKFSPLMRDLDWDHVIDLADADHPVDAVLDIARSAPLAQEALAVRDRAHERLAALVESLERLDVRARAESDD